METEWLDHLNEAQHRAVTFGDGPLLIVAGAGTGKTTTLASRVAYLIARGTPPERILLLTFTRRAAAQMIGQVRELIASPEAAAVWHGTFHAVSNRLLRIYGQAMELATDFTVMDQGDSADMLNLIRGELGYGKGKRRFPRKVTLNKIYSYTVNAQQALGEVIKRNFPWCIEDQAQIAEIFKHYVARKREHNVLDFDDLLLFWRALVTVSPAAQTIADRFDHLLVDEYQDTNKLQSEIVLGMRKAKRNVVAVGDDAQSIYSFRSATIRNILDFPDVFPGTEVITLEKNYRSTQPILAASNAVMEQARERYTKNLFSDRVSNQKPILHSCQDEDEQTHAVCTRILDHFEQGIPLRNQAVLFRSSNHSAKLEIELSRRNIPFHKFGGLKFVEAAHVKDALAYLRILENQSDQLSWYRILLLLQGIGPTNARRIISAVMTGEGDEKGGQLSPIMRLRSRPPRVPAAAHDAFRGLIDLLARCSGVQEKGNGEVEPKPPDLSTQVEFITIYYSPICKENYDNAQVRIRDLERLVDIAAGYRSRGRFITDLTLDPPVSTSDFAGPPLLDDDYLVLSTIHSAKGCEWTSVHLLHAADGHIPSDMAVSDKAGIDEERRLFYVAMTRAKDWLYLYFPLRYYHSGNPHTDRHSYAQLTRFIDDRVKRLLEKRFSRRDESMDFDSPAGAEAVGQWLDELFDG